MGNKKGLIAALVALVAVIAVAGVGYNALGSGTAGGQGIALSGASAAGSDNADNANDASGKQEASGSAGTESAAASAADTVASGIDASDAAATSGNATGSDTAASDGNTAPEQSGASEPVRLADFAVQDLNSDATVNLSSIYGKPSLVGFWGTWCPPCNEEAPTIQKMYETYGDRINFFMINAGRNRGDNPEVIRAWMEEGGYTYPVYFDPEDEAAIAAQVYYLPTMYVLDAQGNVLTAFSGSIDEESGMDLAEQLLEYEAESKAD